MNFKFEDMTDEELQKSAEEFEKIEDELEALEEKKTPFSVSAELDKKMLKMIREFESIELKKNKKKKNIRYLRIAVMLFLCIGVGMTVVTMNVDAFRIKLFDFLIEDHKEYIDVNIVEKGELSPETKAKFPKEWDSVFYPMALPEGYSLVESDDIGGIKRVCFENKNEVYINMSYDLIGAGNLSINSEDAEVDKTQVNGKEAIYSSKQGCNILVWSESGYQFLLITFDISIKETIKIAESVSYIDLK